MNIFETVQSEATNNHEKKKPLLNLMCLPDHNDVPLLLVS